MREERKVVTALFADIVGSTALGERLDPEDVREILGEAVARSIRVIEDLGGTIKDLAGDGVLALFGAPVTHEDDAERAVRAGLGILQEIAEYAVQVERDWRVQDFGVRVGIESGLAVLGPHGAGGRIEYGATGDALNTAARLQSAARPGGVLVGRATHRLVEPIFDWGARQDLEMKGKAEPFEAYEALAVRPEPGSLRGIAGIRAAVMGRDEELAVVHRAARALASGRGGNILLVGEAGLGKSRLVAELGDAVAREAPHASMLEGRSASFGQALPYLPFRDLLRDWLGVSAVEPEERVRERLEAALADLLGRGASERRPFLAAVLGLNPTEPETGALSALSPEALQFRTFEAVWATLAALGSGAPLVAVLEDMHWADRSSLLLSQRLLSLAATVPVLLVMTMRPDPEHPSSRLRVAAEAEAAEVIDLYPLAAESDRRLLGALVGESTLPGELEERLLASSEGNPFFLEELVRSLIDAGALVRADGGWRFERAVTVEVPATVEKVILARLDRLPAATHDVASAASVLGRQFELPLLEAVAGSTVPLLPALDDLERLELVDASRRDGRVEYRFRHALIQETAYNSLLRRRRRDLHRRAAEAIEALFEGRLEGRFGLLAHHQHRAGDLEPALSSYRRAADSARRLYAVEEALLHYSTALEVASTLGLEPSDAVVTSLHLERGRVRSQTGDAPGATTDVQAALDGARAGGDRRTEMEAEAELGSVLAGPGPEGYPAAFGHLERALAIARELQDRATEASVLAGLAILWVNSLAIDRALENAELAVAAARGLDDERPLARAMDALKQVAVQIGDFVSLEDTATRLAGIHRRQGDLWRLQFCLFERAFVSMARGEWDVALSRVAEAHDLNRRIRDRGNEALYATTLCRVHILAGDYGRAIEFGKEGLSLAVEVEHAEWVAYAETHLAWALTEANALQAAVEHALRGIGAGQSGGAALHTMRGWGQLALARWRLGQREAALEAAARAEERIAAMSMPPGRAHYLSLNVYTCTAEVRAGAGDTDAARRLLEPLLAAAEASGWRDGMAEGWLGLAMCAEADGEVETAVRWWGKAIQAAGDAFPGPAWRARAALARALDRAGRRPESRPHAEAARAIADRLASTLPEGPLRFGFSQWALSQLPGPSVEGGSKWPPSRPPGSATSPSG